MAQFGNIMAKLISTDAMTLSIWRDFEVISFFFNFYWIKEQLIRKFADIRWINLIMHFNEKKASVNELKRYSYHQDSARPHASLVTRQKLLHLEWDTLFHPPYSSDLVPSDYYLFRTLQHFLVEKTFTSNEFVKNHLGQGFDS